MTNDLLPIDQLNHCFYKRVFSEVDNRLIALVYFNGYGVVSDQSVLNHNGSPCLLCQEIDANTLKEFHEWLKLCGYSRCCIKHTTGKHPFLG